MMYDENIELDNDLYNSLRDIVKEMSDVMPHSLLNKVINPFNLESIFELDAELYEELLIDL